MTTAKSPKGVLRTQAKRIAKDLKAAERGEKIADDPGEQIAAARDRESVKFAVAMDDKILTIEMTWETIRKTSEAGIAQFIYDQMREKRRSLH